MKISNAKIQGFTGIVIILIIIAITIILKGITLKTGIIMSILVVALAPITLWLVNLTKKHDDNIHYNDPGSRCYHDKDPNCTNE
jgi:hypothetical protein